MKLDKDHLEKVYRKFNRPEFIHPDPLEFVWRYRTAGDRETAGLIAACLAYGNVKQILKSVDKVLAPMGESPSAWIRNSSAGLITRSFLSFKHRFTTGAEMTVFLLNIRNAFKKHGSLEKLFLTGYDPAEATVEKALYSFVNAFNHIGCAPSLTPCPEKKSSFKRINLFLRWMVRNDKVDPGVWKSVKSSGLIIPLDTHMFQVAKKMGLTARNDTSMRTALEITAAFRKVSPLDPARYDFCLTRAGIRRNNV